MSGISGFSVKASQFSLNFPAFAEGYCGLPKILMEYLFLHLTQITDVLGYDALPERSYSFSLTISLVSISRWVNYRVLKLIPLKDMRFKNK